MSYELMKEILGCGANLPLETSVSYEQLRELVSLATETGAHVTVHQSLSDDLFRELAALGKKQITFVYA